MTSRTRNLLLLVGTLLLVIIVGGLFILSRFNPPDVQTRRDHIINDLYNLSADCYRYRTSSGSAGGGDGSYLGYIISKNVRIDTLGGFSYRVVSVYADSVILEGRSEHGQRGSIQVQVDHNGKLVGWRYFGELETP